MQSHDKDSNRSNSQSRRKFLRTTGGFVGAGLVTASAGCSGGGDQGQEQTPTASDPDRTSQLTQTTPETISTKIAAAHYPLIPESMATMMAIEKGFFEKYNVSLESVTSFSGGGTTIRGVVTGGLAAGKGAFIGLVKAFLVGAPVHLVAIMTSGNYIDFHVRPESEIESIQDAAGKSIALTNPGSSGEAVAINCLKNADGISVDDVTFKYVGGLGEIITTLKEGAADIGQLVEPVSSQQLIQNNSRRVWTGLEYAPNTTQHIMLMGQRVLDEQPQLAKGIVRGHVDGMAYVRENPQESAHMWADAAGLSVENVERSLEVMDLDKTFRAPIKEEIVKSTADAMRAQGILNQDPPWDKIIRQDALPKNLRVDWVG